MRNSVHSSGSGLRSRASAAGGAHHTWRSLTIWVALLAQAQTADVITTQADTLRGGVEANQTAAFIMNVGGPGFFWLLKLLLVLVMALAATLAFRYRERNPGRHADLCVSAVVRTMQFCVVALTLAVLCNASVAAQLSS